MYESYLKKDYRCQHQTTLKQFACGKLPNANLRVRLRRLIVSYRRRPLFPGSA